jgi:hypothetical protein
VNTEAKPAGSAPDRPWNLFLLADATRLGPHIGEARQPIPTGPSAAQLFELASITRAHYFRNSRPYFLHCFSVFAQLGGFLFDALAEQELHVNSFQNAKEVLEQWVLADSPIPETLAKDAEEFSSYCRAQQLRLLSNRPASLFTFE